MGHMFDSPDLGPRLKIRLSSETVVSLLTCGCESWSLTQEVMRKLNGCNSQMLVRITGRSVRDEVRSITSSFDLVKTVRVRRLRWLGQILRGDQTRLLFTTVVHQYAYHNRSSGDLFMDLSASDFRFFRVPEPILNPLTVIYLFRRKVTKPTIEGVSFLLPQIL